MTDEVRPSAGALREALALSDAILKSIELSERPLSNIALMTARLARLLNDFQFQKIFEYEASGYPSSPDGVASEIWALAELANRISQKKDDKGEIRSYANLESIEQLEAQIEVAKLGLDAARDANVASANPNQYVSTIGNTFERQRLHGEIKEAVKRLGARRSCIHTYASRRNLELKFSGIASDAFARIREFVDQQVSTAVPTAVQKFSAIYRIYNRRIQKTGLTQSMDAAAFCKIWQTVCSHLPINREPPKWAGRTSQFSWGPRTTSIDSSVSHRTLQRQRDPLRLSVRRFLILAIALTHFFMLLKRVRIRLSHREMRLIGMLYTHIWWWAIYCG